MLTSAIKKVFCCGAPAKKKRIQNININIVQDFSSEKFVNEDLVSQKSTQKPNIVIENSTIINSSKFEDPDQKLQEQNSSCTQREIHILPNLNNSSVESSNILSAYFGQETVIKTSSIDMQQQQQQEAETMIYSQLLQNDNKEENFEKEAIFKNPIFEMKKQQNDGDTLNQQKIIQNDRELQNDKGDKLTVDYKSAFKMQINEKKPKIEVKSMIEIISTPFQNNQFNDGEENEQESPDLVTYMNQHRSLDVSVMIKKSSDNLLDSEYAVFQHQLKSVSKTMRIQRKHHTYQ